MSPFWIGLFCGVALTCIGVAIVVVVLQATERDR